MEISQLLHRCGGVVQRTSLAYDELMAAARAAGGSRHAGEEEEEEETAQGDSMETLMQRCLLTQLYDMGWRPPKEALAIVASLEAVGASSSAAAPASASNATTTTTATSSRRAEAALQRRKMKQLSLVFWSGEPVWMWCGEFYGWWPCVMSHLRVGKTIVGSPLTYDGGADEDSEHEDEDGVRDEDEQQNGEGQENNKATAASAAAVATTGSSDVAGKKALTGTPIAIAICSSSWDGDATGDSFVEQPCRYGQVRGFVEHLSAMLEKHSSPSPNFVHDFLSAMRAYYTNAQPDDIPAWLEQLPSYRWPKVAQSVLEALDPLAVEFRSLEAAYCFQRATALRNAASLRATRGAALAIDTVAADKQYRGTKRGRSEPRTGNGNSNSSGKGKGKFKGKRKDKQGGDEREEHDGNQDDKKDNGRKSALNGAKRRRAAHTKLERPLALHPSGAAPDSGANPNHISSGAFFFSHSRSSPSSHLSSSGPETLSSSSSDSTSASTYASTSPASSMTSASQDEGSSQLSTSTTPRSTPPASRKATHGSKRASTSSAAVEQDRRAAAAAAAAAVAVDTLVLAPPAGSKQLPCLEHCEPVSWISRATHGRAYWRQLIMKLHLEQPQSLPEDAVVDHGDLLDAVEHGDVPAVYVLLNGGHPATSISLLHCLSIEPASAGVLACMAMLMTRVNPLERLRVEEEQHARKLTYLHLAVYNDSYSMLPIVADWVNATLQEQGSSESAAQLTCHGGRTSVHVACELGHYRCLKALLNHLPGGPVDLNGVDRHYSTALIFAARCVSNLAGALSCVRLLLREGADCNAKDSQGYTALEHALRCSNDYTARELFLHGATLGEEGLARFAEDLSSGREYPPVRCDNFLAHRHKSRKNKHHTTQEDFDAADAQARDAQLRNKRGRGRGGGATDDDNSDDDGWGTMPRFAYVTHVLGNPWMLARTATTCCDCEDCSQNVNCPCVAKNRDENGDMPYTRSGRLSTTRLKRNGRYIYECGPLCNCRADCPLRVVQRLRREQSLRLAPFHERTPPSTTNLIRRRITELREQLNGPRFSASLKRDLVDLQEDPHWREAFGFAALKPHTSLFGLDLQELFDPLTGERMSGRAYDAEGAAPTRTLRRSLRIALTPGKGWGVFANETIKRGEFVAVYCGELLSREEFLAREEEHVDNGNVMTYAVEVDCQSRTGSNLKFVIDGETCGNVTRFINHSCAPNLNAWWVFSGRQYPDIAFFAAQRIEKNTELTWQYTRRTSGRIPCRCGEPECTGYL